MKKILSKTLISILLLSFSISFLGCEKPKKTETATTTKGFIWKVTSNDKHLYLVGTMHPSPKDCNFFNESINKIIDESSGIAVECNMKKDNNFQSKALSLINLSKGTIEDSLTKDEISKLKQLCKDNDINYDDIKKLSPLGILQTFQNKLLNKIDFTGPSFDSLLINEFNGKKKEIVELESVDFQLDLSSKIYNIDTLKKCLNEDNNKSNNIDKENVIKLFDAFKDGSLSYPEESIREDKKNPEYYKLLVYDRNINMTSKIENLLNSGKVYMVAVGYKHYVGEDSIIEHLKEKGYKIERLLPFE
ncbi:hypothetical protein SAMN02745163_01895 [Clostridium cavendishii DSM 21758]|uniref:TraB family protein n=1 Tax=Clostridium cavendishii DSM 21758 TaxID=1121302 RepID=A0A1M6J2W2_9CLOT|nr:TraB/GumN family protein [Clostridium cavendishii]SHJ41007.1 hypothetical protein SAMN02745163_01895 [Clostridium cavendishii DSM 21758]